MSSKPNSLSALALQKFKSDFWGVFSFLVIVIIGLISVFAYALAPDNSEHANQMHLAIHSKKPGFKVQMLEIPSTIKNQQNFFDKLFFGSKNTETEIPISSYTMNEGR